MNYTIAIMTNGDEEHPLVLSMDKCGNKYSVRLSEAVGGSIYRTFYSLDKAYAVYEKIASWVIFGVYTGEERRRFLETGVLPGGR